MTNTAIEVDVYIRDLRVGDRFSICGKDVFDKYVYGDVVVDGAPIRREINHRTTGEYGHYYEVNVAFVDDPGVATTIRYGAERRKTVIRNV